MAVGRLIPQPIALSGTLISVATPTVDDGDKFQNDGQIYLQIANGSGNSIDVTVTAPNPCSHGYLHDLVVAVAAGTTKYIGRFNPNQFNDAGGDVLVKCSAVTNIAIAAIKV